MKIKISELYCKYVINFINDIIKKNYLNNDYWQDILYESYLKLEEMLKEENL